MVNYREWVVNIYEPSSLVKLEDTVMYLPVSICHLKVCDRQTYSGTILWLRKHYLQKGKAIIRLVFATRSHLIAEPLLFLQTSFQMAKGGVHIMGEIWPRSDPDIANITLIFPY